MPIKNPLHIPGWTYMGHHRLKNSSCPEEAKEKLKEKGASHTVEKKDRYYLYKNQGLKTATGGATVICWYRRFKPGRRKT